MNLHYTGHALARMKKRRIEREWVAQTVAHPARIEPDAMDPALEHRLAVVFGLDGRVLRVIVSKDEPRRVISAYSDRKMKGKL